MPCTSPISGTRGPDGVVRTTPRGPALGTELALEFPCGRCTDCRIAKAQDWATRCMHEAQMHKHPDGSPNNAFITLTFDEKSLIERGHESVDVRDWQLFAKKLRKQTSPFKFLAVGEYGDQSARPHYHALIFGEDFSRDRYLWRTSLGNPFYRSPTLEKCWPWGQVEVGHLTQETANYVCRYVLKKLTGHQKEKPLEVVDQTTGEISERNHTFAVMSRGGRTGKGIGHSWLMKYGWRVIEQDNVIRKGQQVKPPRYYTAQLKAALPDDMEKVAEARRQKALEQKQNNTYEKRKARNNITKAKLALKRRSNI